MDTILTVNDVAEILKVKPITVREMFREERIRGFKVGKAWRTTEAMLQEDIEYLARGEQPPKLNNATAAAKTRGNGKAATKTAKKKESRGIPSDATFTPAAETNEARETAPKVAEEAQPEQPAAKTTNGTHRVNEAAERSEEAVAGAAGEQSSNGNGEARAQPEAVHADVAQEDDTQNPQQFLF